MASSEELKKIQNIIEEFFLKMTVEAEVVLKTPPLNLEENILENDEAGGNDIIDAEIKASEPQVLIGEGGQTLMEIQRILRSVAAKKLLRRVRLNIDINDYRKKKIDYLKALANDSADEVAATKEIKELLPMPAYERRIIHTALADRRDVITESQGEGAERKVIIKPKT